MMLRESCILRGQHQATKGIDLLAFGLAATWLLHCGHFLEVVVGSTGDGLRASSRAGPVMTPPSLVQP